MPSPGFIAPDLDPEAEELLVQIVDLAADVPRSQQQFLVSRPLSSAGVARVTCAGQTIEAAPQDLKALRRGDVIETAGPVQIGSGTYTFHLTRKGTVLAQEIRQRGEPLEKIEDEAVRATSRPRTSRRATRTRRGSGRMRLGCSPTTRRATRRTSATTAGRRWRRSPRRW